MLPRCVREDDPAIVLQGDLASLLVKLGQAARQFVLSQQGATEWTLDLLDQLIVE